MNRHFRRGKSTPSARRVLHSGGRVARFGAVSRAFLRVDVAGCEAARCLRCPDSHPRSTSRPRTPRPAGGRPAPCVRRCMAVRIPSAASARSHHPTPTPPRLVDQNLQPTMRRPLGSKPEAARQHVRLKDRLEHDLHRGLHDPIPNRRDRQRPALSRARRFQNEHPPSRQRPIAAATQIRSQLVRSRATPYSSTSAKVTLSIPGAPSLRRTRTHARHRTSLRRILSHNEWNSSPGISLGRPVKRMLQGTDRIPTGSLHGGTSQHRHSPGPSSTNIHIDEAAVLPSPAVVLSARLQQYYHRLRRPPDTPLTSRFGRL